MTREARKTHFQTSFAGLRQPATRQPNRRPLSDSADRPPPPPNNCRLSRRPLADHAHANCRRPQSPSAPTALPPHNTPPPAARQPPNCPPNRRRIARRAVAAERPPPAERLPSLLPGAEAPTWAARPAHPPNRLPNRPPTNHAEPPTSKQPATPGARPPACPLRDCRAAYQPPAGHRHSRLR